jgi:RNA polymerase sigma-70 factor (ECF subfamily)
MKDDVLLNLLRKHPNKGLCALMEQYTGLVCTVVKGVFSPYACFSAEDTEECVSDVFYEFYKNIENFRPEQGSIKSYLCAIAKHKTIDVIRKRAEENTLVSLDSDENYLQIADDFTVEKDFLGAEERKSLFAEINALGEPDREIIMRKFFFCEPTKKIAEHLGLSVGNVDVRTHRALIKLREKIGEKL